MKLKPALKRLERRSLTRVDVCQTAHSLSAWGVRQLTGREIRIGQRAHDRPGPADPALYVTPEGRIQIQGTGHHYLEYHDWNALFSGEEPQWKAHRLCHPDGSAMKSPQHVWDILVHRWGREEVLYAGVMSPTGGRPEARWPQDNWTRRIYAFRRDGDVWVRNRGPLFDLPTTRSWLKHCYGHHFLEDDEGTTWIFYEKVTDDTGRRPHRTELFTRAMKGPFDAAPDEIRVLGLGRRPYPSTRRSVGGYLMEGPRPAKASLGGETIYFLGFSSGDFPTDAYTMNVAWSHRPAGPYQPLLTSDGRDLLDLGLPLKTTFPLSWGPARPCFFQDPNGRWWTLFHAVDKTVLPRADYTSWPSRLHEFHRNVYLAPLTLRLRADGSPEFHLGHSQSEARL